MWKHARGTAGYGPVAVLISDTHFSHQKPSGRAGTQEDWYRTMHAHISEVLLEAKTLGVPLFIAGDVFHTWDQPVELVNAVASWLAAFPTVDVMMVPGQHDLPYHSMADIEKAAIWNLHLSATGIRRSTAGGVHILHSDVPFRLTNSDGEFPDGFDWYVVGAGWGEKWRYDSYGKIPRVPNAQVLLCAHQYVHACGNHGHPSTKVGDDSDVYACEFEDALRGYAAAVFGDNHDPFEAAIAYPDYDLLVYNHGCFIRRTIKEREYRPEYGVLRLNGTITRHTVLAADDDKWHDGETEYKPPALLSKEQWETLDKMAETGDFVKAVKDLTADKSIDIVSAVNRLLGEARLSKAAKREILELLPSES